MSEELLRVTEGLDSSAAIRAFDGLVGERGRAGSRFQAAQIRAVAFRAGKYTVTSQHGMVSRALATVITSVRLIIIKKLV